MTLGDHLRHFVSSAVYGPGVGFGRPAGGGGPRRVKRGPTHSEAHRSTQGIFYAVGHMITASDEQVIVPDPSRHSAGEPLFRVDRGASAEPCLARADYNGEIYCVPLGRARNAALVSGLLAQLLALNTSINDLPLTSLVRITT